MGWRAWRLPVHQIKLVVAPDDSAALTGDALHHLRREWPPVDHDARYVNVINLDQHKGMQPRFYRGQVAVDVGQNSNFGHSLCLGTPSHWRVAAHTGACDIPRTRLL